MCSLAHRPLSRDLAVAAARRRGSRVLSVVGLLSVLGPGSGCGTAVTGERRPTALRTDDLPAPRRMTPDGPRVVLAPAHVEPDLVDDRPAPTAAAVPAPGTHRVAAGETLYRIARSLGITPGALAEMNGFAVSTSLAVGQVLVVPAPAGRGAAPATPAAAGPQTVAGPSTAPGALPPALAAAFDAAGASPPASAAPGGAAMRRSDPSPDDTTSAERGAPAARREARGPGRIENSVLGAIPSSTQGSRPPPMAHRSSAQLQWPLRGVLYARFGRKGRSPHDGIDLSAPAGTPVRTAGEGAVLFAGPQQGYGLLVIIEHAHGLVTVYAHNRDLRVKTGQTVREGQVIATVGESGKTSGPHLHFEVRQDGAPVDPLGFLGAPPSA